MIADILLLEAVPADVEAEIRRLFGDLGATPRMRAVPTRRSATEVTCLVLATLSLDAFVKALVSDVTDDAYERLKALLSRLFRHGAASGAPDHVPMVLQDSATRLKVVLEPDLPLSAYRRLAELDLAQFKRGPLHYDRQRSQWRSELDEAAKRS